MFEAKDKVYVWCEERKGVFDVGEVVRSDEDSTVIYSSINNVYVGYDTILTFFVGEGPEASHLVEVATREDFLSPDDEFLPSYKFSMTYEL